MPLMGSFMVSYKFFLDLPFLWGSYLLLHSIPSLISTKCGWRSFASLFDYPTSSFLAESGRMAQIQNGAELFVIPFGTA